MNTMIRFTRILICLGLALCASYAGAETQAPTTKPQIKLYVFDCGILNYDDDTLKFFSVSASETTVRDLFVPCYVIEHKQGRLLWEGGLPSNSLTGAYGWQENKGWRMRLDKTFQEQLAQIGLGMDDFDYMAFSHLHFDHIGVANEVKGGTLLIQKDEYDAAFAEKVTVPAFKPELYNKLEQADKVILNGEHDVFGDGRVRLIPAPGHTPGHQVLFLDLNETGPIVLSGDLYHFRLSRERKLVPIFNVDKEKSLNSIEHIEQFLKESGAELWIEHELAQYEQIKKMPGCKLSPVLHCI
ncbi:MAG: N-acyl homoserine lactonase family protein [Candidatus Parabeggiatoa sp. nov. 3]|nr:MAG: N-acyl homoserine lactonase family protein [Gammaproteobacteria bacterium]RKZ85778.1 MAG: N-acyl homoserine lactonase family protein [Gammaproteobacteria bacterium]